tara:strand:+ start:4760 stop:5146 length:387 start_codon:yes stop_codon:yes gene_type:complete
MVDEHFKKGDIGANRIVGIALQLKFQEIFLGAVPISGHVLPFPEPLYIDHFVSGMYGPVEQEPIIVYPDMALEGIENNVEVGFGINNVGHMIFFAPLWVWKPFDQVLNKPIGRELDTYHLLAVDHQMI